MKKFCTIFFITLLLIFSCIVVEASSIQEPALWPAISDINLSEDGNYYIFDVNVMVYCPDGIEGDLLVAAYNENNRLLNISYCGKIEVSPYTVPGNCNEKSGLGQTFPTQLNIAEKDKVKIKVFLINLDTLKPEIKSGEITFFYNNGDSYVEVGYILAAKYNETLPESAYNLYYYYYYNGNCDKIEYLFKRTGFQSSYFKFASCDNLQYTEIENSLNNTTLLNDEFSGVKIFCYIDTTRNFYFDKDFSVSNIKIYCEFEKL